jgi:hypothetical protein
MSHWSHYEEQGLISNYTVAQFKPHAAKCNEDKIENIVDRKFNNQPQHNVVVSDLTYVRVGMSWNYIFHTNRGNEFKNKLIDETLDAFSIKRFLSMKGCPYNNAVTEATYKIIKTEFVRSRSFASLEDLQVELGDYVNWFNNHRIHSSLNYLIPSEFKQNTLKKLPNKVLTIQKSMIKPSVTNYMEVYGLDIFMQVKCFLMNII